MNTRFLETLIALAKVGSFREAAEALHVTQTAVSQRIANLEDELGVDLIDRSSRQLRLTAHGQQVVEQSRRIVALTKELLQQSKQGNPVAGPVHIGATETVVKTWLSPLIQALGRECPLIELEISVDTSRSLQDLFLRKKIDLMFQDMHFMPATESADYVVRPICDYLLRWVSLPRLCSDTSPLHALREIVSHRIMTFSKFSLPHANLLAFLMDHEFEHARIANFPSVESILQLLLDGYGVAAIPPVFVLPQLQAGTLKVWNCPAPQSITMQGITRRAAPRAAHEVLQRAVLIAHETAAQFTRQTGKQWMQPIEEAMP